VYSTSSIISYERKSILLQQLMNMSHTYLAYKSTGQYTLRLIIRRKIASKLHVAA
jgi:hypothetical protein